MSETVQTLSATKQRQSLGETKKKEKAAKRTTRTTVIIPGEIEWPVVSEKGSKKILELLEKLAVGLCKSWDKPRLCEIRNIPIQERKEFKKRWTQQKIVDSGFDFNRYIDLRKSIFIGVNSVSKALELNKIVALLIEKDVDPPIITRALIPIADAKNVPVIAIEGLNKVFYSVTKIRCIALGFESNCVNELHHFRPIVDLILKRFQLTDSQEMAEDEKIGSQCVGESRFFTYYGNVEPDKGPQSEDEIVKSPKKQKTYSKCKVRVTLSLPGAQNNQTTSTPSTQAQAQNKNDS